MNKRDSLQDKHYQLIKGSKINGRVVMWQAANLATELTIQELKSFAKWSAFQNIDNTDKLIELYINQK